MVNLIRRKVVRPNGFSRQYWNYKNKKSFRTGQVTIGFLPIKHRDSLWLLFHVGKITQDLNKLDGVGYEYEILPDYEKYFGRLIIKFENSVQTMIRKANFA